CGPGVTWDACPSSRGDAHVGHQREVASGADGRAVHRGYQWHLERGQPRGETLDAGAVAPAHLGGVAGEHPDPLRHVLDVPADGERGPRTTEYDASEVIVRFGTVHKIQQPFQHRRVREGVAALGAVEGPHFDGAVPLDQDVFFRLA